MLNKLSYSVTFPTTGRTLAGEFEFKPGFGLINGANEQGKSVIRGVGVRCGPPVLGKLLARGIHQRHERAGGGNIRMRRLAMFLHR